MEVDDAATKCNCIKRQDYCGVFPCKQVITYSTFDQTFFFQIAKIDVAFHLAFLDPSIQEEKEKRKKTGVSVDIDGRKINRLSIETEVMILSLALKLLVRLKRTIKVMLCRSFTESFLLRKSRN